MASSDHRLRLERQLMELRTVELPRLLAVMTAVDGKDLADQADRMTVEFDLAQVEARIQRLSHLLADEQATSSSAQLAGALPVESTLVLDFGGGPEAYRFGALDVDDGLDVVTPDSPLGRALIGAAAGQQLTYATPRGDVSVTVLSIGVPAAASAPPWRQPAAV